MTWTKECGQVKAAEALAILANALKDADGIEILDHTLRSEARISIDEIRNYVRLNFDDLSHREGRDENIPPD